MTTLSSNARRFIHHLLNALLGRGLPHCCFLRSLLKTSRGGGCWAKAEAEPTTMPLSMTAACHLFFTPCQAVHWGHLKGWTWVWLGSVGWKLFNPSTFSKPRPTTTALKIRHMSHDLTIHKAKNPFVLKISGSMGSTVVDPNAQKMCTCPILDHKSIHGARIGLTPNPN